MSHRHVTVRVQNARIAVSASLHHFGSSPVPFLCECDDEGCHEVVPLSLLEYEQLRNGGGFVLAAGHAASDAPEGRLAGG